MSYQKFTKDILFMGLTQFIPILQMMLLLPVITKLLGPLNYGIWAQIMVTISLINPIASLNLPYTLVRFLSGEKNKKEIQDGVWSVFSITAGVTGIIALFFILFANPISHFFNCGPIFIQIMAMMIILDCLTQLFLSIFRAFQQVKKYVFFATTQSVVGTLLVILVLFKGGGLLGAFVSLLAVRIIFFLIVSGLIIKVIGTKLPEFSKTKEYFSFSLPGAISNISFWMVQSSDRYLITFFLGVLFVGYYAPAYTLSNAITIFAGPICFILPAVLSKSYDENKLDEARTYLTYSLKYFLAVAIPAIFGLSFLSRQLLSIFSTPEISQHAYFIVPFVATGILLDGAGGIISHIISIKKKTKVSGIIWFGAAFVNLGLNLILIPLLGILGAAITTLVAYIFAFLSIWIYCNKIFPFKTDWKFILKSVFASLLMSALICFLNPLGLWRTLATIILGALLYFILIFLLKGFGKKELQLFYNVLR